MNEVDAATLIAYIASLDPRLPSSVDPFMQQARLRAWSTILDDVPVQFALDRAQAVYRQGRPERGFLDPASIRGAWHVHQERIEQRQTPRRTVDALVEALTPGAPLWFRTMYERIRNGEDPDAVERDLRGQAGARRIDDEEEARERRCRFHKTCVCPHLECRDGWLDEQVPDPTLHDPGHTRVVRCPVCAEAMVMADELRPPEPRRSPWRR